ncbi:MAG: double zinc ribbon domain-containing protein [Thermomicrobiales bacterium]
MEAIVARSVQVLIALSGAYLVALWFVLVVWAYRDIEARSKSVVTQLFSTLLVMLFNVPGVLLYMILRPKESLDEAFQRSLEEEYLLQDLEELPLCSSCQRYVEDDFLLCPHCQAQLREPCVACARLVDLRWAMCPYCGEVQGGKRAAEPEKVEEPAARWVAPSLRRRKPLGAPRPVAAPVVAMTPAVTDEPSIAEAETPEPAVAALTVVTADGETATIRPFDRRRTRAAAWKRTGSFPAAGHSDDEQSAAKGGALASMNGRKSNGRARVLANGTDGQTMNADLTAESDEPQSAAAELPIGAGKSNRR